MSSKKSFYDAVGDLEAEILMLNKNHGNQSAAK